MQRAIEFSPLVVGAMRLGELDTRELERFVDGCIDLGLRDFDHADIYGRYTIEEQFGEMLARRPDLRGQLRITTKCGIRLVADARPAHRIKSYDSSREHILASVDNSLRALRVEHIEVLLIHRPDYLMEAAEVARAFEDLRAAGKVRHFGVSNFSVTQLELLHAGISLVNHQLQASVLHLDALADGTLDQCQRLGIVPSAWSPLGGGAVFGTGDDPRVQRIRATATELGERYSARLDQVLLAWLMRHPAGIVPVLGTAKLARVETALGAANIELTREDWYRLLRASVGADVA